MNLNKKEILNTFFNYFLLHIKIYKKKRKNFFIKFYKLKMNKIQQHELDF